MASEQTQGNSGWSLLLPKEHAALITLKNAFQESCSPELSCQARGLFPEINGQPAKSLATSTARPPSPVQGRWGMLIGWYPRSMNSERALDQTGEVHSPRAGQTPAGCVQTRPLRSFLQYASSVLLETRLAAYRGPGRKDVG